MLEVSLSSEFQQLDAQQQQRLQTFIDAMRDDHTTFEQIIFLRLDAVKDADRAEHEATRDHSDMNHRETRGVVQSEHEATRLNISEAKTSTCQHISQQHDTTRQYIGSKK